MWIQRNSCKKNTRCWLQPGVQVGLMHVAGYGAGYQYNHDFDVVDQTYLPDELLGTSFFK